MKVHKHFQAALGLALSLSLPGLFSQPAAALIAMGVNRKFIKPQLTRHIEFMEGELQKRRWFAGRKFSAADIQMSFPLEAAQTRKVIDEDHPTLLAFLDRIHHFGTAPTTQRPFDGTM